MESATQSSRHSYDCVPWDAFLEILNSLLLVHIATELSIRARPLRGLRRPCCLLLGANLVLSRRAQDALGMIWFDAAILLRALRNALAAVPTVPIGTVLPETTLLLTVVIIGVNSVILWGSVRRRDSTPSRYHIASLAMFAVVVYFLLFYANVNEFVRPSGVLKFAAALGALHLLAWVDVRRTCDGVSGTTFLIEVALALQWVLFMYPVLAVAVAVLFLLLTEVMERLGVDPHCINELIYYGVFYGPLCACHARIKQRLLRNYENRLPM